MNITTPIDDEQARALPAGDQARLLGGASPVLLVDGADRSLVAANAAAERLLGLAGSRPAGLDRTMPAWPVIAAFAATAAGQALDQPLLFWTADGPRVVHCKMEHVQFDGRALIRLELAATGAAEPGHGGAEVSARAAAAAEKESDLATLREIARRIRAGIAPEPPPASDGAAETTRQASVAPATLPPPLDFRPPAGDSGDGDGQVAASSGAAAARGAAARLAHELRTPLSAIVSLAEIMRDERFGPIGGERYRSYAADIHDSARHTLDLVGAMLDGERTAGDADEAPGLPRLDLDSVDLGEIAGRCVSAMQPIAARGEVTLIADVASGLPPLLADRRALRQILLNLLSNGLRYTARGGSITVSAKHEADGTVSLLVADTGQGMTAAEIARALARSSSGARPRRLRIAGEHAGMGFGLPLVRDLVEAHGGTLSIDSGQGRGTRIAIRLPADRVLRP